MRKANPKEKKQPQFNPYEKHFIPRHDIPTLAIVACVCFLHCCVLSYFYEPYHFLSGGVTGLSLLFGYLWNIPKWVVLIGLNIPIAIIGIKFASLKFSLFSLFATACYSVFFELPIMDSIKATGGLGPDYALLSAIVGSAIIGVTCALVVKRGASLGGIDIISIILNRRLSIPAGSINIVFNIIIMSTLIHPYGVQVALMSMLSMFINNTAYNFTLEELSENGLVSKISAESARWDSTTASWRLRNYFIRDYGTGLQDRVRSGKQLDTVLSLTVDDFYRNKYTIIQLDRNQLNELIRTQRARGDNNVMFAEIEKNNRLSMPFSAFILTIIGVSLSTRKRRGGIGWNIALGIALGFSYILFMKFSEMFVHTGTLPASIALWLPNVLYLIIAAFLYHRASQ